METVSDTEEEQTEKEQNVNIVQTLGMDLMNPQLSMMPMIDGKEDIDDDMYFKPEGHGTITPMNGVHAVSPGLTTMGNDNDEVSSDSDYDLGTTKAADTRI